MPEVPFFANFSLYSIISGISLVPETFPAFFLLFGGTVLLVLTSPIAAFAAFWKSIVGRSSHGLRATQRPVFGWAVFFLEIPLY